MTTLKDKQQLVQDVLDLVCNRVDGGAEVGEVMLNTFCFLMQDMGLTMHEVMSLVMDYYKRNPVQSDANH